MNFSFYIVDANYCDFLRQKDKCVPYNKDNKETRPFVGIVFMVNGYNYYAPLTSPKAKHLKMKNQLDFLKIENGEWGAINFNNMIPVPQECLTKVQIKITDSDTNEVIAYKNLLSNQLSWCNSNKEKILKKAKKLYSIITNNQAKEQLTKRCCNFLLDEEQCDIYSKSIHK